MYSMDIIKVIIAGYLLLLNLLGFVLMGTDKKRARNNQWRIPEKTLFMVAILGGSLGSILGMKYFRHKTKHYKFIFGMPAVLIIQLILILYIISYY
ncbi:MAG: hypothetical protein K0S18_1512 [Anaerocolumna sp.]|jgi:uncharacterized membrane protein YsdA (DUF1294 family)|nr:hypothetical protein [Anaerocolumna sp.]